MLCRQCRSQVFVICLSQKKFQRSSFVFQALGDLESTRINNPVLSVHYTVLVVAQQDQVHQPSTHPNSLAEMTACSSNCTFSTLHGKTHTHLAFVGRDKYIGSKQLEGLRFACWHGSGEALQPYEIRHTVQGLPAR